MLPERTSWRTPAVVLISGGVILTLSVVAGVLCLPIDERAIERRSMRVAT